jgi:hypothetical protein
VEEVALEHISSPSSIGFPLLITILLLCHTHLSPPAEVCNSPEQAAQYHIPSPYGKVGIRLSYGAWLITDRGN